MGSLPLALAEGGGGGTLFVRLREVERGAVSGRTLPAWMRRRRLDERFEGRRSRIRPFKDRVLVVDGCSIVRGRSAMEAVKRMMSWSISSGGVVPAIFLRRLCSALSTYTIS